MAQRIGYFINVYPKVSHTFIRREILAHERAGAEVVRVSIRRTDDVVDPVDLDEATRTHYLLDEGVVGLLRSSVPSLLRRPLRALRGLRHAITLGRPGKLNSARIGIGFLEGAALAEHLEEKGVDHLHTHFGTNSAFVASVASCLSGISYSFTVHGPEEFDAPVALALGEKISSSTFVVAISSFGRSQLLRWIDNEQARKVVEVHCGLDTEFLDAAIVPVPDNRTLVCVGRLCEQKGQMLLVEAVGLLRDRGIDCRLRLVGDGELRSSIESVIAELDLEDRVSILGWGDSDDVKREIREARGFVLPSFAEGLPVVLMEALALGRPVITTYIAGIPELVDDECGWLVPAGDRDALADAVAELLTTDVGELADLGSAGAARVRERHDVEVEARKLRAAIAGGRVVEN
jgi:glycosyltransferase involved in cell wall biosynthesis